MARLNPRLTFCTVAAVIGVSLFSSTAFADDVHQARVLYQKGNVAFKKGDSILARDFYKKSLGVYESFDTRCNLGRAQAEDQLFEDAYFNLGVCVELYPVDKDLADGRERFVGLKNDVRGRLSSRDAGEVEGRVAEHVAAWQKKRELDSMPASGLGESPEEDVDSEVGAEEVPAQEADPQGATQKNGWKMPVVISLAGAGVVSGVVGGVMFGVAGGHQGDADDARDAGSPGECATEDATENCVALYDSLEKRDSAMNMGVGFAAAGGGLLLGSLAVALLVPSEKSSTTAWKSIRPQVELGSNQMSFGLSGRF